MPGRITSVDYNADWALTERFFHAKPVPGYLTREDVIAFYGTLGLAGVELMHSYWDDYPLARLKSLAGAAGLPIVSYIFFVDLIAPAPERQGALDNAFALIDRHIEWKGTGPEEKGIDRATGQVLVEIDPRYFRPTEVEILVGDPSRAHSKLNWKHKISFDALVEEMVKADMLTVREEQKRINRHA